ncbi:MAG: uracil-DNA glycosylase [Cyclobacteriaceae bacterium]
MDVRIAPSWKEKLAKEFDKAYFEALAQFLRAEYQNQVVYPPGREIFRAFDLIPFDQVKVVILGQDPYHGPKQANGLAFSVRDGITKPPSLINIFKEIRNEYNKPMPDSGNLERWAQQGILLLNSTLTVRARQAGSHQKKGWEEFTDAVIKKISDEREGVVFLLWGAYAQKKGAVIDESKHYVLKSAHPSPFAADRGFFGNNHFKLANEYLGENGKEEIDW